MLILIYTKYQIYFFKKKKKDLKLHLIYFFLFLKKNI